VDDITKFQTGLPASPTAYEELSITASVTFPTAALVALCTFAIIKFEKGPARFRDDGTNPTAAVGVPIFNLDQYTFSVASLRKIGFIRSGGTNMVARIRYYI
jgi:hypothetical protein